MCAAKCILLGGLTRQTLISSQNEALIDQPGGDLLYAAAGAALWGPPPGLVARVGKDYPQEWIEDYASRGLDVAGIRRLEEEEADQRDFIRYQEGKPPAYENPIKHFADLDLPLPKFLLGYQAGRQQLDKRRQRGPLTLRAEDLPPAYREAHAAHLCGMDYLSHQVMPTLLRQAGIKRISLAAGGGYMHPDFWNDLPELINGLSAFLVGEEELRSYFGGRSHDLWAMAEWLGSHNCASVIVQRGGKGSLLYISEGAQRLRIPAYPSPPRAVTGGRAAYGGGVLAGLLAEDDPLTCALRGAISLSLAEEGFGAFYALESSPRLAQSRLEALRDVVQAV